MISLSSLCNSVFSSLIKSQPAFQVGAIRFASKKASGVSRNKRQACGKHRGWKVNEGGWVKPGDILATQNRANWLAGLNVRIGGRMNVQALKEGRVIVTCENPDLDYSLSLVNTFFGNRTPGIPFYKKYYHVIPKEQHKRFKLIDQI